MPRAKGSLNRPKITSGFEVIKFEKHIEGSPITKDSNQGWVNWGLKNDMPNQLLNLYSESPTHHSACEFAIASILGNGVDFEAMKLNGDEVVPNLNQTWDEIIKALATDYILFGSYALEVIMNKDGKTFSFYHIPLDKVRWSPYDESGEINSYWISADWTALGQNPPFEIEALNFSPDMKLEKGTPYLYVYRTYSPTMTYYTQPHYSAGIKAIQSEIEFVTFDLKHVVNGFTAAGVLVLPEVDDDSQKRAIINNIQSMFQGSEQANSLAITFKTNVEQSPVEYTPFTQPTNNVNLYADSNQRCINRILCSHQIPNACLCGLPDIGNNGFSSEADKLEVSYQLYNKLTGNKNRMAVVRTLNQMFALNGVETQIVMKPLNFSDFGDDANVQERTKASTIGENDVKDQDEEKVE